MGRFAKDNGGGDFQQAPAGTHVARCVRITDIGTHHGEWQGKPTVRNQVIVMWELPNEMYQTDDGDKPFVVSRFYTNSLGEKANLRKDLESWRGIKFTDEELDGFDLMNILDKPCLLSVIHSEDKKAKIATVSKLVKGMECPPAFNKPEVFWIDEWEQEKFDAMSDGIKKIIMDSDEYKVRIGEKLPATNGKAAARDDLDNDIPF